MNGFRFACVIQEEAKQAQAELPSHKVEAGDKSRMPSSKLKLAKEPTCDTLKDGCASH